MLMCIYVSYEHCCDVWVHPHRVIYSYSYSLSYDPYDYAKIGGRANVAPSGPDRPHSERYVAPRLLSSPKSSSSDLKKAVKAADSFGVAVSVITAVSVAAL